MKNYVLLGLLLLSCFFYNELLGKPISLFADNDTLGTQFPNIDIPDIDGVQSIKAMIKVKPYNRDKVLSLVGSELRYLEEDQTDNRQLWWVIQDYEYHAFALVNASNTDKWLYYDVSTGEISMVENNRKTTTNPLLGEYLEKQYFFEFEFFEPGATSSYALRSLSSRAYLQTENLNSEYSNWHLAIGDFISDRHSMYFDIKAFKGFSSGDFVYLPMSETNHHTQTKENRSLTIRATRRITDNKSYLSSSHGFLANRIGGENMFKVTFDSLVTESTIGLLHYRATIFNNSFYQKQGNRKPIAGIQIKDNHISLFNKDIVVPTSFKKGIPIIFGYKKGELIASQLGETKSIAGVPTPTLLNSTDGNKIKLLMHLPNGKISIGYNPSLLLFGHNFEGEDNARTIMTNPYMSVLEDPEERAIEFDWTTKVYNLRYKDGIVYNEQVQSPFYYSGKEEFGAIVAKHDFDGRYLGGEDFEYYDGWELIAHDFGYDRFGNEKPSAELRNEPYMILYNRYTSRLRVFVYLNNQTIANNLKITLSDGPISGTLEKYRTARLWGSYLQGRALDDPELSTAEYSKMLRLKSTRGFYFTDFTLSYSPCISKYESNLRITVSKITQGDLEIVGRTKGGVIPVNSPAISDWLSNSNHYLTGVLNTPYGELNSTLGDINFRNYNQWGEQEWSNNASFILPGKKVQAWEKEFASLQHKGFGLLSSGEAISGAAKFAIGGAQIATAADITHVSTKIAVGIGTIADGVGQIMKGSGFAVRGRAWKLKYDNLRDVPDKNINITLPPPQPSVIFSELVAKGKLSIETLIFDDVVITTPGSKYSEYAPNTYRQGSKGAYPLYNQSLGAFNLLYQPKTALVIIKQSSDIGGYLRLKNRPYLAVNGDIDYTGGFFIVNYVVTTYDASGYSTNSNRSKPHLFIDRNIQGVKSLPMKLDITELLDKKTLLTNIDQYTREGGSDIENKINDWVTVELEVGFLGYTGKNSDGTYGVANLSNTYKLSQVSAYEDATEVNDDINSLLADFSDLSFGADYLGDDVDLWLEHYLISSFTDNYSEKMDQYCQSNSDRISPRKLSRLKRKLENSFASNYQKVNPLNPLKEIEAEGGMAVYPNPSNGIFTVDYLPKEKGKVELMIYDQNGGLLVSHSDYIISNHSIEKAKMDISSLRAGIYIFGIRYKSGKQYTRKLIKN